MFRRRLSLGVTGRNSGQVLNNLLCVFCLSSSRFTTMIPIVRNSADLRETDAYLRNKDALVFAFIYKIAKCFICHCKYMWSCVFSALSFIHFDIFIGVYGQRAVRIHGHQEKPRVSLYAQSIMVSSLSSSAAVETYVNQVRLVPSV